jgi:hypothetical protein
MPPRPEPIDEPEPDEPEQEPEPMRSIGDFSKLETMAMLSAAATIVSGMFVSQRINPPAFVVLLLDGGNPPMATNCLDVGQLLDGLRAALAHVERCPPPFHGGFLHEQN